MVALASGDTSRGVACRVRIDCRLVVTVHRGGCLFASTLGGSQGHGKAHAAAGVAQDGAKAHGMDGEKRTDTGRDVCLLGVAGVGGSHGHVGVVRGVGAAQPALCGCACADGASAQLPRVTFGPGTGAHGRYRELAGL